MGTTTTEKKIILNEIEIKYLKEIIPSSLYKKFNQYDIYTINDVLSLSKLEFKAKPHIGLKIANLFEKFKSEILSNPEKFKNNYLKNREIVLPLVVNNEESLISILKNFLSEYKKYLKKKKGGFDNLDFVNRRFGIGNYTECLNLIEIAKVLTTTKQRVKIIQDIEIKNLRKIINGEKLKQPLCKANIYFLSALENFKTNIGNRTIISDGSLKIILNENSTKNGNHIKFLMHLLGFEEFRFKSSVLFCRCRSTVDSVNKAVLEVLKENISPMHLDRIIINVHKVLKKNNKKIDNVNSCVVSVLRSIDEYEVITENDKEIYQLRLDCFRNAGEMGVRILDQLGEGVYSKEEILRNLNNQLIKYGVKTQTSNSLATQLSMQPEAEAVQKRGWALRKWKINTGRILDLITKTLEKYNDPMKIKEISSDTIKEHPEIDIKSIRAIIGNNKNKFIKLQDGRVILKEWKKSYKDQIKKIQTRKRANKNILKSELQIENAIKILKNSGKMRLSLLVNQLEKEYNYPQSSIYKISNNKQHFVKSKDNEKKSYIELVKNLEKEKNNQNNDILNIIKGGETDKVEFKSTLRWDIKEKRVNKLMEYEVTKTIAAFLNTEGGTLLIGVDDVGEILGLKDDFRTFGKKNRDAFQLHLNNLITNNFGKDIVTFYSLQFHKIYEEEICEVKVKKSNVPKFIKKDDKKVFLCRLSGISQHLDIEETYKYIHERWN